MSKHRAADTSLTLTPLSQRLAELSADAAKTSVDDPRFADVHRHIAQVANAAREVIDALAEQHHLAQARHDALVAQIDRLGGRTVDVLDAGVRRLETSSDALAAYLDDRDAAIEGERDRVLRDVLEDFAASLHARERRTVARRLIDAIDRRRDARDAARWRREHGAEQRPLRPRQMQPPAAGHGPRVIDLDAASRQRKQTQRR
ncbi:MAG: hypothetical protein ABIM89_15785 [Mycobacteriales bacterium]